MDFLDPFTDVVSAELVERVEARLRQTDIRTWRTLEENQVSQATVDSLLRDEIVKTFKDYADMRPSTLIGIVNTHPTLLKVAEEDLQAGVPYFAPIDGKGMSLTREAAGLEVWINNHHPVKRDFESSTTLTYGESWAEIASDPAKAGVVAKAMAIDGYREGEAINPPDLIRNIAIGRLRYAGLDAFQHDFSEVMVEVNAGLGARWQVATTREQALEGLAPEWQSFLKASSGQPILSELREPRTVAETVFVEPPLEL